MNGSLAVRDVIVDWKFCENEKLSFDSTLEELYFDSAIIREATLSEICCLILESAIDFAFSRSELVACVIRYSLSVADIHFGALLRLLSITLYFCAKQLNDINTNKMIDVIFFMIS